MTYSLLQVNDTATWGRREQIPTAFIFILFLFKSHSQNFIITFILTFGTLQKMKIVAYFNKVKH